MPDHQAPMTRPVWNLGQQPWKKPQPEPSPSRFASKVCAMCTEQWNLLTGLGLIYKAQQCSSKQEYYVHCTLTWVTAWDSDEWHRRVSSGLLSLKNWPDLEATGSTHLLFLALPAEWCHPWTNRAVCFWSWVRSRVSSTVVFLHRVLAVSTIRIFAVRPSAELEMSFKSYSLTFHIAMSSSHFLFKVFNFSVHATSIMLA